MSENFVDLIVKKRDKNELSTDEINFFVEQALDENFPDYQISSMLMAMFLNGLSDRETSDLTMAMANSGKVLNLSEVDGMKVDKHSTGGVSDTTTLVLAPLTASCGLSVVKMSGKGLGHTGGTIDKIESIPGFNTEISNSKAMSLVKNNGIVIMGQTENLAPADKRFYAIRDVTGTVESMPLIASSIMSKKIAAGCDALVLDVKCGNGAFMKDFESAEKLANTMVEIGKNVNKRVIALITDMNQPLGNNIGNSFEVIEAMEVLKGNLNNRLREVSLELGSYMLILGNICQTRDEAISMLEENIKNGKGIEKFRKLIALQNGNPDVIDDYSLLPKAECKKIVRAQKSGYINLIDTYGVGKASLETGAGRRKKSDLIDYGAGIILKHSLGDKISEGEILAEVYAQTEEMCDNASKILKNSIFVENKPPMKTKSIIKVIGG